MSKLVLNNVQQQWEMNVLAFNSGVTSQIQSAQTKTMQHHYPIRTVQGEVQFSVIFPNETQHESFQRFVRNHHQNASRTTNLVFMNWPERNIDNWTGVITQVRAGGARRNYTPQLTFGVMLVDSLVSRRTENAGLAELLWRNIYGAGMGPDAVLGAPSAAENNFVGQFTGQDLYGNRVPRSPDLQPFDPNGGLIGGARTGITTGSPAG